MQERVGSDHAGLRGKATAGGQGWKLSCLGSGATAAFIQSGNQ